MHIHDLQKKLVAGLNANNDDILDYIRTSSQLSAKEHLAIYQSSIFGSKQTVLKEIYAVCHKLVGNDFFIAMINQYIPQTISTSYDLASYGEDFYHFIANYQPAQSLPYLSDVARLEWAWHKLFTGSATKAFDFQLLAECYAKSAEQIVFLLSSNSTLIASPYPIHRIWEVNQDDYLGDQAITLPNNAMFYYLVWSQAEKMRIDLLEVAEWQILSWMQAKLPLGEICAQMADHLAHVNFEELLPSMIQRGWLKNFEILC